MSDSLLGGWSTYACKISSEDMKVFETTMDDIIGVEYEPFAVANQVVAGMNYGFLCNASPVVPDPVGFAAVVYIHVPLPGQGNPRLVNIEKVPTFDYAAAKE